ncbi:MAG: Hsp20/alpha crystallin family protein [Fibrobacter sp.]|nr:Hsp20/alpha crystallin family protein [Fibrobacter sp.]
MGIFGNLLGKLFGTSHNDDETPEVVKLEGRRKMDNSDTLIFTGQPDYTSTIMDGTENGSKISPAAIAAMQQETARISAANPIDGQINVKRGRGVGNMPQQMPPQPPRPQQQPFNPQMPPPPAQQAPQQYYPPQQQYYPQPQQPPIAPAQNIPISGDSQSEFYLDEPFSELVLTNNECHVIVDLPGVKKNDVSISLTPENDVKIVYTRNTYSDSIKGMVKGSKGKRPKIESQINIPDYLLGKHEVSYHIPRAVDESKITCSFEYGQVHVVLGLRVAVEGVTISIA